MLGMLSRIESSVDLLQKFAKERSSGATNASEHDKPQCDRSMHGVF